MRASFVCIAVLTLTVVPASASPVSAQRIDTRFSDLGGEVELSGLPTRDPGAIVSTVQVADSTPGPSSPSLTGMTLASSLGSLTGAVAGLLLGIRSYDAESDLDTEGYLAATTFAALGSVPGSSLGAWIVGRDEGVGFGAALGGGFLGLVGGIALELATGGATFPGAFVVGQGFTTALVARAFAD